MIRKFLFSFLFMVISNIALAAQNQIELIGPVGVQIASGWSTWSTKLNQPIIVNPLRVLFWHSNNCPVIPATNVSIKFTNDTFWYSTNSGGQGYYYAQTNGLIEAVKLDFYQNQFASEYCVIKILGYR